MRRFIISALVLSAVTANAQVKDGMVGINTDEPRATMHIEPGVSESKGLIIPRITAAQMKTMTNLAHFGADHHAIITYLKETLPAADRTGKLVDVADPGYYYYDNTTGVQKWKTFGGGAEQDFKVVPASLPGFYSYLTKGAGIGGNGTSLGTGFNNIGIGRNTFKFANSSDMTGNQNIGLGNTVFQPLNGATMWSNNNIGIGNFLYSFNDGGTMGGVGYNVGLGNSLYTFNKSNAQFSGYSNTAIGQSIFFLQNGDLTGSNNIGMGEELYTLNSGNLAGSNNIGIGRSSFLVANGDMIANNNIALGNLIYNLSNSSTSTFSGNENIGIGYNLYNLSTGSLTGQRNIGMGDGVFSIAAGDFSGNDNIGIGNNAMYASGGITGNNNIALGYRSMYTTGKIAGTDNIAIGFSALYPSGNTDIGSYNIGIGNWALWDGMAKGNANIQLGNWYVGIPVAGQLNQVVAIGNEINNLNTSNADSKTILLGVANYHPNTPKVGVGTYKPKAKMHVTGEVIVGDEGGTCTYDNAGAIRVQSGHFYGCNGTTWKQLDN